MSRFRTYRINLKYGDPIGLSIKGGMYLLLINMIFCNINNYQKYLLLNTETSI